LTEFKLPTPFQQFIHLSRYSRWREDDNRRETWTETVDRYMQNVVGRFVDDKDLYNEIRNAIGNLEAVPSMRALMTAGPALDRDHMAGFNCSFVAVDNQRVFDEALYILSCGTGLGFSVERQFISELPVISEEFHPTDTVIIVADSRIGWASSFRQLISLLYAGQIPKWDLSKLRPKGAKLKTFGGRSSGPEPLHELFEYSVRMFTNAAGRKLNSIEYVGVL
jgi:ribonucleoside-triphosphate reductase